VLDLLLRDETNPRSLIFQVNVMREHATALVGDAKAAAAALEDEKIQSLVNDLRSFVPDDLTVQPVAGAPAPLPQQLNRWSTELAAWSEAVTNRYFSHSVPRVS
jgi:uncharacterized alpha-E superfamily protein